MTIELDVALESLPIAGPASHPEAGESDRLMARALHPAGSQLWAQVGPLLPLLESLVPVARTSELAVCGSGERAYERLLASPRYEVWLIAWGPSTALELHDHGGAVGALQVIEGSLVEISTDLCTRAPLRSEILAAGRRSYFGSTRVHEVWNPSGRPSLSLHVYSPPITEMTFYDSRPERYLEPSQTIDADGEPERAASGG